MLSRSQRHAVETTPSIATVAVRQSHSDGSHLSSFLSATTGLRSPRARLEGLYAVSLYRNALYLIFNNSFFLVLTGFAFWIVAARFYSDAAVGISSAAISALGLLGTFSMLGLDYGLIRFLPESKQPIVMLNSCYTLATLLSLIVALVFVVGVPLWSPELGELRHNPLLIVLFMLATWATSLQILTERSFVAKRRSGFALSQGMIFGLLRFVPLLLLPLYAPIFGVLTSWTTALCVATGISLVMFSRMVHPGFRLALRLSKDALRGMLQFSIGNFTNSFLWTVPSFVLPLLVLNILGAELNAYFYVTWRTMTLLTTAGNSIAMSFLAEAASGQGDISQNIRRSLKMLAATVLPMAVAMALLGDKILLAFGSTYSENATNVLRLLAVAAVPASINLLYMGLKRAEKNMTAAILLSGVTTAATVGLSVALMPSMGIDGVAVAWLAAQTGAALIVLPLIIRKRTNTATANVAGGQAP